MDFNYTTEQQAFRSDLRGWLEKTSAEIFGENIDAQGVSIESRIFGRDDREWETVLEYHRRLYRAGYLALHWPKEWGGAGAGLVEQAIYQDEVLRLGLPLYGGSSR
jgi:alkylation response protein AidB-like acyl-CoA dehydrogenase